MSSNNSNNKTTTKKKINKLSDLQKLILAKEYNIKNTQPVRNITKELIDNIDLDELNEKIDRVTNKNQKIKHVESILRKYSKETLYIILQSDESYPKNFMKDQIILEIFRKYDFKTIKDRINTVKVRKSKTESKPVSVQVEVKPKSEIKSIRSQVDVKSETESKSVNSHVDVKPESESKSIRSQVDVKSETESKSVNSHVDVKPESESKSIRSQVDVKPKTETKKKKNKKTVKVYRSRSPDKSYIYYVFNYIPGWAKDEPNPSTNFKKDLGYRNLLLNYKNDRYPVTNRNVAKIFSNVIKVLCNNIFYNLDNIALICVPSSKKVEGEQNLPQTKKSVEEIEEQINKGKITFDKNIINYSEVLVRIKDVPKTQETDRFDINRHLDSIECKLEKVPESTGFIILDDVTTSGITMEACKEILIKNGVDSKYIIGLALAETIEREDLIEIDGEVEVRENIDYFE